MFRSAREFLTQYFSVVLFTLAPVILTTFFTLPYYLKHSGAPLLAGG